VAATSRATIWQLQLAVAELALELQAPGQAGAGGVAGQLVMVNQADRPQRPARARPVAGLEHSTRVD